MKKYIYTLVLSVFTFTHSFAQSSSPYKTSFKVDAPVTVAGMGLSGLGLYLMQQKDPFTDIEAENLNRNDVNGFDRFSAGNHSKSAKKASDMVLYSSLAAPALLLFDKDISQNGGQLLALYVETMSITGTLFTLGSAAFPRARPLTYSKNRNEVPLSELTRANAQNSFFAGHTAAVSTISFFTAKVFHDYNPDSPARPFVWAGAAIVPAAVGYLRLEAGKHFLSDNLIGYGVGAAVGILVPQLHKKSNASGLSITPSVIPVLGQNLDGVSLRYKF
ncbi:phosphatase PAP2 family protein [Rufibacter immobilis]|uniref:Phosphatase PAP2 family protein n=1 Tax=Rufibacter immobilis TaxID=1348778 RepID=A0A3M9N5T9_9BACT|nr:phosphatase PAP2 family protein [Rufibacter immobilis]RNI33164.1 phosphatase PAP2 family protein [Rufibacter immobilis]